MAASVKRHFSIAEALARLPGPAGERSAALFTHGTLLVKVYAPPGHDPQTPHTRDELYVIMRGTGLFFDGDTRRPVCPGDFLFAPAGRAHRFEQFSEDFATWVVYYGPEGGERAVSEDAAMEAPHGHPGPPSPYLIQDLPGFTPQIGRLVVMMNYARLTTVQAVEGLTTRHLDYLHDSQSNTIGALLGHIAAVEVAYQADTFEGRDLSERESREWNTFLELGEKARREIRGHPLEHYLRLLTEVRQKTLSAFAQRTDQWLDEQAPFWGGQPANNYFKWFHVLEDEINHRGQIRWLRRRLPG